MGIIPTDNWQQTITKSLYQSRSCTDSFIFRVELPSDYSYEVKMIQARKFSAALTDRGEIYIWGFKSNVGGPKLIKN